MTHDHHDTVVVEDRGGSGLGAILGILAIVALLVAIWYFALGPGASPSGTTDSGAGGGGNEVPVPTEIVPASS
mgnify:CR=1 FL=1